MVITFLLTQDYIPSLSAWIKKTVRRLSFFAGAEGFVLACRLGRCFCFAEVSTGDPHPSTRSTCRESNPFTQTKKKKSRKNDSFPFWQGQKDSNPRHVVLETTALPTELYPYIKFYNKVCFKS